MVVEYLRGVVVDVIVDREVDVVVLAATWWKNVVDESLQCWWVMRWWWNDVVDHDTSGLFQKC